jgi:N-acetylglucosamine-6-phosphate deacetylase
MSKMFAVKVKTMISPLRVIDDAVLFVKDGTIEFAGSAKNFQVPEGCEVIELGDKYLVPGFFDIHHHGAMGQRAGGGGPEGIKKIGQFLPSTGCTSWLPTVNAEQHCIDIVQVMKEGTGGADIPGIHMEGPFLEPKNLPGKPEADAHLKKPDVPTLEKMQEAAEGNIRLMGVGITMPGAHELIRAMRGLNIVPSIAHSKGGYEDFMAAVDAGLSHATHIYNVMTGMHHRRPGITGGILSCDAVTGELIGDGFHVHPAAMDVVYRCKGPERVALITDQSELAGLPDGRYVRPNGVPIIKKDGICRMEGFDEKTDNTMAGSTLTMDHNVRTLVNKVHIPLKDVIRMATLTPATIVGIDKFKGSLEPGKDADFVVLSKDLVVESAYVRGVQRFQR